MNLLDGKQPSKIQDILRRSTHAVCGPQEREVVVKRSNLENVKRTLSGSGFFIVGTGPAGPTTKKIWFNPRVSL